MGTQLEGTKGDGVDVLEALGRSKVSLFCLTFHSDSCSPFLIAPAHHLWQFDLSRTMAFDSRILSNAVLR